MDPKQLYETANRCEAEDASAGLELAVCLAVGMVHQPVASSLDAARAVTVPPGCTMSVTNHWEPEAMVICGDLRATGKGRTMELALCGAGLRIRAMMAEPAQSP